MRVSDVIVVRSHCTVKINAFTENNNFLAIFFNITNFLAHILLGECIYSIFISFLKTSMQKKKIDRLLINWSKILVNISAVATITTSEQRHTSSHTLAHIRYGATTPGTVMSLHLVTGKTDYFTKYSPYLKTKFKILLLIHQLQTRYRALHGRMSHRTGASKTCLYISDHRK